jgi:hypothetical protein
MAEYTLTIRTDDAAELKNIMAEIANSGAIASAGNSGVVDAGGPEELGSSWTPERFDQFWRSISEKCKRLVVYIAEHPEKTSISEIAKRMGTTNSALGGVLSSQWCAMKKLRQQYGDELPWALEYNYNEGTSRWTLRSELVEWVLRVGEGMKG